MIANAVGQPGKIVAAARTSTGSGFSALTVRAIARRRADEAARLLRAHIEQSKLEVRHITLDMLHRARRRA